MRAIAAAVIAVGCHTSKPAEHAPPPRTPSVVLCKTTEAELRASLGTPTRDGIYHQSRVLSWIVADDDVVHYLGVLLDAQGVVVDQIWNVPSEIPWVPTDQCARAGSAA